MKTPQITLWVFIIWVLIAIVDMWFDIVTGATLIKVTLTLLLLLIVFAIIEISRKSGRD